MKEAPDHGKAAHRFLSLLASRSLSFVLLATPVVLGCGCTSALWENDTFAHHYGPAYPANLHLFYSNERKDILVQYDESEDGAPTGRSRCYWLEPNMRRVSGNRKPHFVSVKAEAGLTPVPVREAAMSPTQLRLTELYAVARCDDDFFTLYSGKESLDPYKLPNYAGKSQRVKQVLLTPLAVGVDATIVGAVVAVYSAPQILTSLNR